MATTVLSEPERFLIWNIFQDKVVASSVTAEETFFGDNLEHIDSVDSMANIEAGNDEQLIIRDLVESYGLTLSTKKGVGTICAISTVEQIYKKYGYHGLNRVLRLIIGAWEGDMHSFSANMLNGVARLVVVYGDTLNDALFVEKLGAVSVKHIMRTAKERKAGSMGVAEAMILEYNGKKKSNQYRLQISKLYSHQHAIYRTLDDIPDDMLHDDVAELYESGLMEGFEDPGE